MSEPRTLTEAWNQGFNFLTERKAERTWTNARTIPYVERYAGASALIETPIEHLDRAAKDEAARSRRHQ